MACEYIFRCACCETCGFWVVSSICKAVDCQINAFYRISQSQILFSYLRIIKSINVIESSFCCMSKEILRSAKCFLVSWHVDKDLGQPNLFVSSSSSRELPGSMRASVIISLIKRVCYVSTVTLGSRQPGSKFVKSAGGSSTLICKEDQQNKSGFLALHLEFRFARL
jgi:hypothetical protein